MNFFAVVLEFSISCRVGTERKIIFIFSPSHHYPTYFGLKWIHNVVFYFLEFFWYFFLICYLAPGRNEMEWWFLFSVFLDLFEPILDWNEAIMVFFNFLNFFAIFLKISISRRVGTEGNGTIIFIFALSNPFATYFDLIRIHNVFFNFLNFFAIFFNFLFSAG